MSNAPKFYQPLFGNDNFYAPDVVDMTSFNAIDAMDHQAPAPTNTPNKKTKKA